MPIKTIRRQIVFSLAILLFSRFGLLHAEDVTHKIYRPIDTPVYEETLHGDVLYYGISHYLVSNDNPEERQLLGREMWIKSDDENPGLRPFASFQPETPNSIADITTLFVPLKTHYLAYQYANEEMTKQDETQLYITNDAGRLREVRELESMLPNDKNLPLRTFEYNDKGECVNFKTYSNCKRVVYKNRFWGCFDPFSHDLAFWRKKKSIQKQENLPRLVFL